MGGNMFLIPADEPHHPIAMMPFAHCREAVLRFTASKHDAICCSSDRKSARAALGLARNTISQDSGNSDSYFVQAHGNAFSRVARDRVANSFGNGQADTAALHRRCIARYDIVVHQIMHDDVFSRYPTTAFEHRNKIAMAFQPFHRSMPLKNQAARDLRPLARRRLIRARPARVRMR